MLCTQLPHVRCIRYVLGAAFRISLYAAHALHYAALFDQPPTEQQHGSITVHVHVMCPSTTPLLKQEGFVVGGQALRCE